MGKNNNHRMLNFKQLNKYKSSSRPINNNNEDNTIPTSKSGENLPNLSNFTFSSKGANKSKGMNSVSRPKGIGKGGTSFSKSAPGQGHGQGYGGGGGQ